MTSSMFKCEINFDQIKHARGTGNKICNFTLSSITIKCHIEIEEYIATRLSYKSNLKVDYGSVFEASTTDKSQKEIKGSTVDT